MKIKHPDGRAFDVAENEFFDTYEAQGFEIEGPSAHPLQKIVPPVPVSVPATDAGAPAPEPEATDPLDKPMPVLDPAVLPGNAATPTTTRGTTDSTTAAPTTTTSTTTPAPRAGSDR